MVDEYPGHPLGQTKIREACNELAELLISKQTDYGTANIEKFGSYGVMVRLCDKMGRLETLKRQGRNPNHESLEDTFLDVAGYGILGLLMQRQEDLDADAGGDREPPF